VRSAKPMDAAAAATPPGVGVAVGVKSAQRRTCLPPSPPRLCVGEPIDMGAGTALWLLLLRAGEPSVFTTDRIEPALPLSGESSPKAAGAEEKVTFCLELIGSIRCAPAILAAAGDARGRA
jgi:hypothetical protein